MRVRFGYNQSPVNKIYKSVQWPEGGDREGSLVDSCSITDPEILIQAGAGAFKYNNYFWIPDFERFYFITSITSVRTGVVSIKGHVDVLTSFADDIAANTAIFRRLQQSGQLFGFNKYINDGTFKVYQDRYVINKFDFDPGFTETQYVLAMAGS